MSLRPHYHEVFVHYPARFVNDVKRVLFIGGGDNMVLHEILKYPSLELVVGLELDHQISRSSFTNFGTQPHWNNEKVKWWYGDGAKSFLMLPQHYLQTFDLVLVDLQSDVIEFLKVTEELDIMDAALHLLAPEGVIARNVDYGFDTSHHFTKYTVDLYAVDLPIFCFQGVTIGSNAVNFLTQTPKDHNIETLYLDSLHDIENQFHMWYNYRKSETHSNGYCKEPLSKIEELPTQMTSSGVLMIIEAENTSVPPVALNVQAQIIQALPDAGLMLTTSVLNEGNEDGGTVVFILQEGYIVARTWPKLNYCALDLLLWKKFDNLDTIEKHLMAAIGSNVAGKSSSSYSLVTSGMFGVPGTDIKKKWPCATIELHEEPVVSIKNSLAKQSISDTVLVESLSLVQAKNTVVAVLCGEEHCSILEALSKKQGFEVMPIWTCPDVSERMFSCESDTLHSLRGMVEKNGKIGSIIIAPEAPRSMGQVLHKVLSRIRIERELLQDNVVILETSLDPSDSTWRRILLDRFRTEFVKFNPAYRAEVFFNDGTGSIELGVFSSGDNLFYSHFVDAMKRIEDKSGFHFEVRIIKNGRNNYIADFKPSLVVSYADYDHSSAAEQWSSQRPMGRQTIWQFEFERDPQKLQTTLRLLTSTAKGIKETLQSTFRLDVDSAGLHSYSIGNGFLIVALWSQGSVALTWDGRSGINLNLFTYDEDKGNHQEFERAFMENILFLRITSRDEQPRGLGGVVNFQKDIESKSSFLANL